MVASNPLQFGRWTLFIGVIVVGLLLAPSGVAAQQATVTTDGPATASPGETITVTVTLTNTKASQENYIADVSLPDGWSVASHTDDGGTWNGGDVSWLWQNIPANSSVTPTLTVRVPGEPSGGTATIETTAKSKDGAEDTATHTVELPSSGAGSESEDASGSGDDSASEEASASDSDGDSSGGTGSGTSSSSSDTAETESTGDTEGSEESSSAEAVGNSNTGSVHTIEDSAPDQPGTTVETSESAGVEEVTFDSDSVVGELEISAYEEIPEAVRTEISAEIGQDLSGPEESASDSKSGESQSGDDSAAASSESEGGSSSNVSVVTVADISPPEAASNTSASVTFTVSRDRLNSPEEAVITHKRESGWEQLQTEIVSTTDESVTLEATTESFSLFAVVETPRTDAAQPDEASGGESVSDTLSTFHLTGLIFALVSVVLLKRYRF